MIGNAIQIIQWLYNQDKDKKFTIKEFKEKRSLDQNAYAWKLITQIGNELRKSKDEVYFEMLKSYGQSEMVSMLSEINPRGYLKYYEVIGTETVNGREFTHYKMYKGSSEFDKKEMSIFIDGIVQECKQLGIPTLTSDEIALLRFIDNDSNTKL